MPAAKPKPTDPYAPAYTYGEFYIPNYMMGAIERYLERGTPPGHFLTAIITNDLREAVARADDINQKNIPAYIAYFHNEVDSNAWGSVEKMRAWVEKKLEERNGDGRATD